MLSNLFAIIAPVFICAAVGFVWEKRKLPYDLDQITPLVVNIGTPMLVLSTLTRAGLTMESLGTAFGYGVLMHVFAGLIGFLLLVVLKKDLPSFTPSFIFGNTGNMGLPLCLFAFGNDGLALAIAIFAITAVSQFTIGVAIASGSFDPRKLARSPMVWSVVIAVMLIWQDVTIPLFLSNTIKLLGDFTIPVMLISLGVSLARLKVRQFGTSILLAVLRFAISLTVGIVIAEAFGLTGILRGVVIVQASMPAAVTNYLFAAYYRRDAESVAGIVVITTVISFASLPIVLWIAIP